MLFRSADGVCRHAMALFFHVYSKHDSVSEWVSNWKSGEIPDFLLYEDMNAQQNNYHKDGDNGDLWSWSLEAPNDSMITLPPTSDRGKKDRYKYWIELTDDVFHHHFSEKNTLFPLYMATLGRNVLMELEKHAPIYQEELALYTIVTHIRFFKKMLELFDSNQKYSPREIEDACKPLFANLSYQMMDVSDHLPEPIPLSFDPMLKKLQEDLRELLFFDSPFEHDILLIYFTLWRKLFPPSFREEERILADKMVRRSNPDSPWVIAYAMQLFFKGEIEQACSLLERYGPSGFIFVYDFLAHSKLHLDVIERIAPFFLHHIGAFLKDLDSRSRRDFLELGHAIFRYYAESRNRFEIYEQVLVEMMPYSLHFLADFYFEKRQFRRYIELLEATGFSEEYIDRGALKIIQKEDPEALLPFYHWQVKISISRKNRQSYKEAVRHLKKLRTLYKKLKQVDLWDRYFTNLLEETKRLRAFQEECQKGKLIDVENPAN